MWTATLRDKRYDRGEWNVAVTFTNGVDTVVRGYPLRTLTQDVVAALVRAEIQALTQADTPVFSLLPGDTIDTTPPAPPAPTPPDLELENFFSKLQALRRLRRLVTDGLIDATDPRLAALVTTLKADWQARFLSGV